MASSKQTQQKSQSTPPKFLVAHAMNEHWDTATELCVAQIKAQLDSFHHGSSSGKKANAAKLGNDSAKPGSHMNGFTPTLGIVYFTSHFCGHEQAILAHLKASLPVQDWVGSSAAAICANDVAYAMEPAIVLMVTHLPTDSSQLFSGRRPLHETGSGIQTDGGLLLLHADPETPDMPEVINEYAEEHNNYRLMGGLVSHYGIKQEGRKMYRHGVQIANDVFEAGVSGVAFSASLGIQVKVSQGCAPISNPYRITAYDQNLVQSLDGKPALRVLRQTLIDHAGHQLPIEENWPSTLKHFANRLQIGILSQKTSENYLVRSLMGIDPVHQFLAIGHEPATGEHLIFCLRDLDTATHDLRRVCAEIREDVEDVSIDVAVLEEGAELPTGKTIYGALYIACMGRGQALFGASNELKIIQHALGNVPLIGCYASGEIADGELYGMTGILIVFSG